MKLFIALKCFLATSFILCFAKQVVAQNRDSVIYLLKVEGYKEKIVESMDSADFYRVIPPFEIADTLVEVNDYFKNGKLRSAGKCKPKTISLKLGWGNYEGPRISFDANGKRYAITNYINGRKDGVEYRYYPDGKLYAVLMNGVNYDPFSSSSIKVVDFYDKDGTQICANGKGKAIIYDEQYRPILTGPIKNGKMNGDWEGYSRQLDNVKLKLLFKDSFYQSGVSYEGITGKSYSFKNEYENAQPEISLLDFVKKFRKKITLQKGSQITSKMIDSVQIYFEIQPDGSYTTFETINPVPDELMNALKLAMDQCPKWQPVKFYGIPLKTQVAVSLSTDVGIRYEYSKNQTSVSYKKLKNYQMAYYHGIALGALPTIPKDFD